jgi:hypothetical protein
MAIIYQATFNDGPDKALVLSNEEWGRALSIGSNWTRIRMAALLAIQPDETNNLASAQIRIGFSSAADQHYGSQASSHWYGYCTGTTSPVYTGATHYYSDAGGNPVITWGSYGRQRALNGVLSGDGNNGTFGISATTGTTPRRVPIFVELKKSGTNLIVSPGAVQITVGGANIDYPLSAVVASMENPVDMAAYGNVPCNGFSFGGGYSTFANYPTNAATYGEIIAAHVGWNKTIAPLRVYAVLVSRFA